MSSTVLVDGGKRSITSIYVSLNNRDISRTQIELVHKSLLTLDIIYIMLNRIEYVYKPN